MNKIAAKEKSQLRAMAHKLNPIVFIGSKGLTPAVLQEIGCALDDHELIKIKAPIKDRAEKLAVIEQICQQSRAALISVIGHIAIIYRKSLTIKQGEKNEPKKRSNSKRKSTQKR
jgi:RNA-binding protein